MIDLCILIPAVNVLIFNPTAELKIPTKTPNNEVKASIKTHPLAAKTKIRKYSK